MSEKIQKAFSADISIEEGERAVVAKISTAAVDRDGEVLIPMGCNSRDYEKNNVVLLNHAYHDLPIGKCVAIKRDDKAITTKTIFADRPTDYPEGKEWLADTVFSLFKQGVLKGFSVGFEPMEAREPNKKDIEAYGDTCRRIFSKWKLLEYSVVTIPANQEAVAMAVAKGLSEESRKMLFGEMKAIVEAGKVDIDDARVVEPKQKHVVIIVAGEVQPAKAPVNIEKAIKDTLAAKRGVVYIS